MDSVTYGIIIGMVFLAGVFVFTYFETPVRTINRGIRTIDKNIRKLKQVQVLNIRRKPRLPLTLPGRNSKSPEENSQDNIKVYVHEY